MKQPGYLPPSRGGQRGPDRHCGFGRPQAFGLLIMLESICQYKTEKPTPGLGESPRLRS